MSWYQWLPLWRANNIDQASFTNIWALAIHNNHAVNCNFSLLCLCAFHIPSRTQSLRQRPAEQSHVFFCSSATAFDYPSIYRGQSPQICVMHSIWMRLQITLIREGRVRGLEKTIILPLLKSTSKHDTGNNKPWTTWFGYGNTLYCSKWGTFILI